MRDLGKIIEIKGNQAKVSIEPHEGCQKCSLKDACSPDNNSQQLWALNLKNGQIGDQVIVELKPALKVFGNALVFIFPLLGLFLGYFAGYSIACNQDYAVVGSVLGIILFFIILKIIDRWLSGKQNIKPTITHIVS